MGQTLEQRLREALAELPTEDVEAVVAFVRSLAQKGGKKKKAQGAPELSETEHARIVAALDAVAALSVETGPPVSNREHDTYLYGGR